jgi:hypothetical protein
MPVNAPSHNWQFMQDGVFRLMFNHQSSSRGGDDVVAPNWWMGMASGSVGSSQLTFTSMFSLDPATIGKAGYREILQNGEALNGRPLIDRQHPHDLFMQLAAIWRVPLSDQTLHRPRYSGSSGASVRSPTGVKRCGHPHEQTIATVSPLLKALILDLTSAPPFIGPPWRGALVARRCRHLRRGATVAAVQPHPKESRLNETVKNHSTKRSIDAAQALDLLRPKNHSGHLEILGANTPQDFFEPVENHQRMGPAARQHVANAADLGHLRGQDPHDVTFIPERLEPSRNSPDVPQPPVVKLG